jgi:cystathionine beta-lyase/cystathionine gamma-synthase
MPMNWKATAIETRAIHAGDPQPRIGGALIPPIFQSSVYEHDGDGGDYFAVRYPRLNNLPNQTALGAKVAALEGAEAGLVAATGMAAISTTMLSVLGQGGHLLIQDQLYGGTHTLLTKYFDTFGLRYAFIDPEDPASWRAELRSETRGIYTEAITNPLMRVIDHREVVRFAREHGLVSMIDNTFATPVNFRPLELGYDLVLHSATKYLNGHSDLVAGAVVGSAERLERIGHLLAELGGSLDPHACFLLNRGLKTLVLRVRQHNENAARLAHFLAERREVSQVNYPGLETHPHHARARQLFSGCGGMLSFELDGGAEPAVRFSRGLRIPLRGPSLGGAETLITRPATTSHAGLTAQERERLGIRDGLLRLSVGLEATDDLIADFEQALGGR